MIIQPGDKPVITPEKIREWIQEVQERPSSAPLIIKYIADRLGELNEWNEKLRIENLDLRSGNRVDEYERQIKTLNYQLELLKRQINGNINVDELVKPASETVPASMILLVYYPNGRVVRVNLETSDLSDGRTICKLNEIQEINSEPPRLLLIPSTEELMFIFTSGRIVTQPAASIPPVEIQEDGKIGEEITIPVEPNVGETLACLAPISRIALSDFYLQISRKGYTKKIRKALASSIIDNKFIGTGVKVEGDQALNLCLSNEGDQFIFVSYEGYFQCLNESILPFAIVEAMRLGNSDHLVAAFVLGESPSILVMTQIGKIIHKAAESIMAAEDLNRKGRMLYSTARRESGVRVIGAAAVGQNDWSIALHQDGRITLHSISTILGKGSIPVSGELIDFISFPASEIFGSNKLY
jgi:DNA gyrase/topoisomerase IV subunit A